MAAYDANAAPVGGTGGTTSARASIPGNVTSNDCIVSNESFQVWGGPGQVVDVMVHWGDEGGSRVDYEVLQLDGNGYGIFYLSHSYAPYERPGFAYTQTIDIRDDAEPELFLSETKYTIYHG